MFVARLYIIILLQFSIVFSLYAQNTGKRIFAISGDEGDEPKILTLYQNRQGYILTGTTKGLYRFDGLEFYKYNSSIDSMQAVTAIGEVNNNRLWVGFENGMLAEVQKNKIVPLSFEEGYPKKAIRKILFDKTGIIWLATAGEGLYYVQNKRMYNINTDDGLSDNYVYDIILTADGKIKAATDRGLNIISVTGKKKK